MRGRGEQIRDHLFKECTELGRGIYAPWKAAGQIPESRLIGGEGIGKIQKKKGLATTCGKQMPGQATRRQEPYQGASAEAMLGFSKDTEIGTWAV